VATSNVAIRMDLEQLFLDNLPLLDRILAATSRRYRLTKEEGEDFASLVKLKLIADDYAVLRAHSGRSSLYAYLVTVVQHAFLDHRNHLWGKWRPSAEAQRLGPLAVRLDTLLSRDGLTLDEACARVPAEDREAMRQLAERLPVRVKRQVEGTAALESLPAREGTPEDRLLESERHGATAALEQALAGAVGGLAPEDRLLLQLRLEQGVTLASVARSFGHDPRQLYRRWETLLRRLRESLEKNGYDERQVAWALGADRAARGETGSPRPSNWSGRDG
jgi:RNA polymerase sigma factor for flagellar operon FliA